MLLRGAVVQGCDLIAVELTVGVGVGSIDGGGSSTNSALQTRPSSSLSNCDMSSVRLSVPQLAQGLDGCIRIGGDRPGAVAAVDGESHSRDPFGFECRAGAAESAASKGFSLLRAPSSTFVEQTRPVRRRSP